MPDSGSTSLLSELATQVALLRGVVEKGAEIDAVRREGAAKEAAAFAEEVKAAKAERAELRKMLVAIERRQDAVDGLAQRIAALEARPVPASVADVADEVSARLAKRDAEAATRRPWGQILTGLLAALATALSAWQASQAPAQAPKPAAALEREVPDMAGDR